MSKDLLEVHSGDQRLVDLGNAISDAAHAAMEAGLGPDFVCSLLVGVAADYWMQNYQRPCTALAEVLSAKHRQRTTH